MHDDCGSLTSGRPVPSNGGLLGRCEGGAVLPGRRERHGAALVGERALAREDLSKAEDYAALLSVLCWLRESVVERRNACELRGVTAVRTPTNVCPSSPLTIIALMLAPNRRVCLLMCRCFEGRQSRRFLPQVCALSSSSCAYKGLTLTSRCFERATSSAMRRPAMMRSCSACRACFHRGLFGKVVLSTSQLCLSVIPACLA